MVIYVEGRDFMLLGEVEGDGAAYHAGAEYGDAHQEKCLVRRKGTGYRPVQGADELGQVEISPDF
jgi:hypothetical protein